MREIVEAGNNYPILRPISFIVLGVCGLFGYWYCSHCKEMHHLKDTKKKFSKYTFLGSRVDYACSKQYGC